jgi:hypothetical protein
MAYSGLRVKAVTDCAYRTSLTLLTNHTSYSIFHSRRHAPLARKCGLLLLIIRDKRIVSRKFDEKLV